MLNLSPPSFGYEEHLADVFLPEPSVTFLAMCQISIRARFSILKQKTGSGFINSTSEFIWFFLNILCKLFGEYFFSLRSEKMEETFNDRFRNVIGVGNSNGSIPMEFRNHAGKVRKKKFSKPCTKLELSQKMCHRSFDTGGEIVPSAVSQWS